MVGFRFSWRENYRVEIWVKKVIYSIKYLEIEKVEIIEEKVRNKEDRVIRFIIFLISIGRS